MVTVKVKHRERSNTPSTEGEREDTLSSLKTRFYSETPRKRKLVQVTHIHEQEIHIQEQENPPPKENPLPKRISSASLNPHKEWLKDLVESADSGTWEDIRELLIKKIGYDVALFPSQSKVL